MSIAAGVCTVIPCDLRPRRVSIVVSLQFPKANIELPVIVEFRQVAAFLRVVYRNSGLNRRALSVTGLSDTALRHSSEPFRSC